MPERETAFIGKITAGVTHEINNVLASIKEISGLLEDILSLSKDDSFPHKEKFQNSLEKIKRQIQRGTNLTTQLNKFSHLPDNKISNVNLYELFEHFVFLNQRFARLKNVTLQIQQTEDDMVILTNPLQLQMALYFIIQYCLKSVDGMEQIVIGAIRKSEKFSIRVVCEGNIKDKSSIYKESINSEDIIALKEILPSLKGQFEIDESSSSVTIILQGES